MITTTTQSRRHADKMPPETGRAHEARAGEKAVQAHTRMNRKEYMKPLDTRSEDDQARTLEWMYRIFSGSATRKSQAKAMSDAPIITTEKTLAVDPAETRQAGSDTAPPA